MNCKLDNFLHYFIGIDWPFSMTRRSLTRYVNGTNPILIYYLSKVNTRTIRDSLITLRYNLISKVKYE